MANIKRYPFSLRKHAHDLEYRRNKAKNEMYDKDANGTLTESERDAYENLIDDLARIISLYFPDSRGVVWLSGKEWALAHESVLWAESMRG